MSPTTTPLRPQIGIEVDGLRGHDFLEPAVAAECNALLERHGVVVYRHADVDDDQLVGFTRLLGPVHLQPKHSVPDHPEIAVVSLDPQVSLYAGVQRGTFAWHIDGTTQEYPNKTTLLACRELPVDGSGDTEFANTYAAYEALSPADKDLIAGLQVEYGFANQAHRDTPGISDAGRRVWEGAPQIVRPLVWTRRDERKSMLLGSTAGRVVDWPDDEGRALLDRLLEFATQPEFVLRHHWRLGDLVVWDNTGMLHRALPYEQSSRRLMYRTTLIGDEVVA
jgi:alpha-ketoglutarate-dependent taurine dioxygenase